MSWQKFWQSPVGRMTGGGTWYGVPLAVTMLGGMYKEQREQGHGFLYSAARAGIEGFLFTEFMGPMMALEVAKGIGGAARGLQGQAMDALAQRRMAMHPFSRPFADTQNRATMRARAAGLIQGSRQNLSSVLGNEAALFHRRYG